MSFNTFGRGPLIVPNNIYYGDSGGHIKTLTFRTGDSNYTLSNDFVTEDLSVIEGKSIFSSGYRLICNSIFMNNGTISNNGSSSSGQAAGLGAYAGSLGGGATGGAGGDGSVSYIVAANGTGSNAASLGGTGGNGQASVDNAGAAGGIVSWQNYAITDYIGSKYQPQVLNSGFVFIRTGNAPTWTGTLYAINGGGGGGGGGGKGGTEGAYSGGGGGGGGGIVHITCAGDIHLTNGSKITANGGDGGNGGSFGGVYGGGGGGGGGGCIIIVCNSLTMDTTSSISCLGGSPGNTGSGSGSPTGGANGTIIILTPNGMFTATGEITGASYPSFPIV